MVRHVGQKSISEVLNKLMTQIDHDFMVNQIQEKQQKVVEQLIGHLGPDKDEENNLNACTIIQDMFETKEFFNILVKKENFSKIVDFAIAPMNESTKASKTSSLNVLNQILANHIEKLKKKDGNKDEKDNNNDDDDMIVQQNSDDEEFGENQSRTSQTNLMVDCLLEKISVLEDVLKTGHDGQKTVGSFCDTEFVPLGQQRLRSTELILNMIRLKKDSLIKALCESEIFKNLILLVKEYPWNNFLQLKVINICNEVITVNNNQEFKQKFLEKSEITKAFVEMS